MEKRESERQTEIGNMGMEGANEKDPAGERLKMKKKISK